MAAGPWWRVWMPFIILFLYGVVIRCIARLGESYLLATSEDGVFVLSSGFSSDALSLESISGPMSCRQNGRWSLHVGGWGLGGTYYSNVNMSVKICGLWFIDAHANK